jgi:SAM-dependent methyltransferase
MKTKIHYILAKSFRKSGKHSFLGRLAPLCSILDVGCGNNSPQNTKNILPGCFYTGIDIGHYNQQNPNAADKYVITSPEGFVSEISSYKECFDAVISSHNLEHCNDRDGTLSAMLIAVKPGGYIYLSFPCEESVSFPKRKGTLNYYDDNTHKGVPPSFDEVLLKIQASGFDVHVKVRNHRPTLLRTLGWLLEPISKRSKKVLRGTWEFYGFETIIWAQKKI